MRVADKSSPSPSTVSSPTTSSPRGHQLNRAMKSGKGDKGKVKTSKGSQGVAKAKATKTTKPKSKSTPSKPKVSCLI